MKYLYVLHKTFQSYYGYIDNDTLFWTTWVYDTVPFNLPLMEKEYGWDNKRLVNLINNPDLSVIVSNTPFSPISHPELFI